MCQHVGIGKSQYSQTKTTEILIPYPVILNPLINKVVATIYLNNQLCPGAEEGDYVITDGFLPVELVPFQLLHPYLCPEMPFSIGHIPSELSGMLFQIPIVR